MHQLVTDINNKQITYLKDYKPPDYCIDEVDLHFDDYEDETSVKAQIKICHHHHVAKNNDFSSGKPQEIHLNGENLILLSIKLNGESLTHSQYKLTEKTLSIYQVPDHFTLELITKIFPQKNTALSGLYRSQITFCTQCEAEGFRRIIYYLDRPDVLARYTTTMTADASHYPHLLSNGNLIASGALDNNRHWAKWEDPFKKPCYLFALVAGDFDVIEDVFITQSKNKVALRIYVEKGYGKEAYHSMYSLKAAMRWDEITYGREYDLNTYMIVAIRDFNMGAMENKGLNIFNTKYILAKPETATDTDYINIERVVGHEYFHNWSGNRITCRDWFQLTLKEGLTVCRDQLFTEDMTSKGVARIDVVNTVRNHQFPEDAGPMAHPIRPASYLKIDNFYTATVYEKGAEVIRMVRTLLTPEGFRKGMDHYFSTYDGQAVTTENFLFSTETTSKKDLSQFSRWYHQAGTPVLRVKTQYDAATQKYTVIIKQTCPETPDQIDKPPLHIPFALGLIGKNCTDLIGTKVVEIKKPEETFVFDNIAENAAPSLLRHFSAPVELQYEYTNEELALLWQCDTDPFARFEAGQRLMVNLVHEITQAILFDKPYTAPDILVETVGKLLAQEIHDPNLFSRLLQFPSLKYILSQLGKIEVDIAYTAKLFLEKTVAKALESTWFELYKKYKLSGDYVYDNASCGARYLKNLCLKYLLQTENPKYVAFAYQQATSKRNMTDTIGALAALNNFAGGERERALTHFYETYQQEPLVVNKWLALQASTHLPHVLEDIEQLLTHPAFDIKNPNNVYALLVSFGDNTLQFHNKNGKGYRLIADQALVLDALNPQVSGRVVRPLTQWKQMDPTRSVMMRAELTRMMESGKLSYQLFEIVSKSV